MDNAKEVNTVVLSCGHRLHRDLEYAVQVSNDEFSKVHGVYSGLIMPRLGQWNNNAIKEWIKQKTQDAK